MQCEELLLVPVREYIQLSLLHSQAVQAEPPQKCVSLEARTGFALWERVCDAWGEVHSVLRKLWLP